jgi:hypothetical protein
VLLCLFCCMLQLELLFVLLTDLMNQYQKEKKVGIVAQSYLSNAFISHFFSHNRGLLYSLVQITCHSFTNAPFVHIQFQREGSVNAVSHANQIHYVLCIPFGKFFQSTQLYFQRCIEKMDHLQLCLVEVFRAFGILSGKLD